MKTLTKHVSYTRAVKPKRPHNPYTSGLRIYTKPFRHSILMFKEDGLSYKSSKHLYDGDSNSYNYCMNKSICHTGDYEFTSRYYCYPSSKSETFYTTQPTKSLK